MMRSISKLAVFSMSLALTAPQISFGSTAVANTASMTPEATLISSAIALQGERLTTEEVQQQLATVIDHYNAAAPLEGRDQRTEEALISLGVYTPAQAAVFENNVQAASQSIALAPGSTRQQMRQAIQTQLTSIVQSPGGAEFSGCVAGYAAGIAAAAGGVVLWYIEAKYGTTTTYDSTTNNETYGYAGLAALAIAGAILETTHENCDD